MVRLWTLPLWALLPALSRGEGGSLVRRQSDAPDSDSYRLRAHHRVAVLDDYLYIVGGEVSQLINQESDSRNSRAVNSTLSIPLNKEWTNSSVSVKTIENGPLPASKNTGLWVDEEDGRLYSWGGESTYGNDDVATKRELYVFQPDGDGGGDWSTQDPENADEFRDSLRTAEAGCATCDRTGYCLGGVAGATTDDDEEAGEVGGRLAEQLVSLDMGSNRWRDDGTSEFNRPYQSFRSGQAVCGGPGDGDDDDADPLLLFLGGEAYDGRTISLDPGFDVDQMQFFNLTWFNPDVRTWHWQRTSGDTPPARSGFCATGIRSAEGSYDVFVYGGHSKYGDEFESFSDVYVLSIPAFRWFSVGAEGTRRSFPACAATESGQVVVVGGLEYSAGASSTWWAKKDPWPQGLGVFDMNSLEWSDRYNPDAAPYRTPDVVKDWYNNGGLDGIDWSSDEVESMFSNFQLSSGNSASSGPAGGSGGAGVGGKKPVGAIVGGVIGGVAALAIAGGLVWWLLRRRRRNQPVATPGETPREKNAQELESPNVPQEVHGDGYHSQLQEMDAGEPAETRSR